MWTKLGQAGFSQPEFSSRQMADLIAYLHFVNYLDARSSHGRASSERSRDSSSARTLRGRQTDALPCSTNGKTQGPFTPEGARGAGEREAR